MRNVRKLHLSSKYSNVAYTNKTAITCASKFLENKHTFNSIQLQYIVADTISYHLLVFSFHGSVQDYKIHTDVEIVKFA